MTNSQRFDPDWIFNALLEFCHSDDDITYASDHRFRFSVMLNNLIPYLKPGIKVGNIGLSILDPLMFKILRNAEVDYRIIIPNTYFAEKLNNKAFNGIPKYIFDITTTKIELSTNRERFDIVMFYEVMEHLLAQDDIIFSNVALLIKDHGLLLGSVPNAAKLGSRLNLLLGRNIFWPKNKLINGVYGGYGHLREYTFQSSSIRIFLNLLPKTLRAVIFFEAVKKDFNAELF